MQREYTKFMDIDYTKFDERQRLVLSQVADKAPYPIPPSHFMIKHPDCTKNLLDMVISHGIDKKKNYLNSVYAYGLYGANEGYLICIGNLDRKEVLWVFMNDFRNESKAFFNITGYIISSVKFLLNGDMNVRGQSDGSGSMTWEGARGGMGLVLLNAMMIANGGVVTFDPEFEVDVSDWVSSYAKREAELELELKALTAELQKTKTLSLGQQALCYLPGSHIE